MLHTMPLKSCYNLCNISLFTSIPEDHAFRSHQKCADMSLVDLDSGPLGRTSLLVQNWIHPFGLVVSWSRLQGGIWPPVRQRGCHSGAPRPPSGRWRHQGRRACRLGRPVLFSAAGAFWQSEHQKQQCALLEAAAHFDLSASRPSSKGKGVTDLRRRRVCGEV